LTDFQTSLGYFLRFSGRETHQRTNTVKKYFFKNSLIIKKILKNAVFWAIFHTVPWRFLEVNIEKFSELNSKFQPKADLSGHT
jgi:hypothetical protein